MSDALKLMDFSLWLFSTVCGSVGVFCIWASFWVPFAGAYALKMLGLAVAIEIGKALLLKQERWFS